jgi:hypothetical protein
MSPIQKYLDTCRACPTALDGSLGDPALLAGGFVDDLIAKAAAGVLAVTFVRRLCDDIARRLAERLAP